MKNLISFLIKHNEFKPLYSIFNNEMIFDYFSLYLKEDFSINVFKIIAGKIGLQENEYLESKLLNILIIIFFSFPSMKEFFLKFFYEFLINENLSHNAFCCLFAIIFIYDTNDTYIKNNRMLISFDENKLKLNFADVYVFLKKEIKEIWKLKLLDEIKYKFLNHPHLMAKYIYLYQYRYKIFGDCDEYLTKDINELFEDYINLYPVKDKITKWEKINNEIEKLKTSKRLHPENKDKINSLRIELNEVSIFIINYCKDNLKIYIPKGNVYNKIVERLLKIIRNRNNKILADYLNISQRFKKICNFLK